MSDSCLSLSIDFLTNHFAYIHVTVPQTYVEAIYGLALNAQKKHISTYGFEHGETPLQYVESHYKQSIIDYTTDFLFNYFVLSYLYQEIHQRKLFISGEPRLYTIYVTPHADARFVFEVSLATPIELREWKNFLFKAPKRKNYKDIDRQVESFMQDEQESQQTNSPTIQLGDWVCAHIAILNDDNNPIFNHEKKMWLKIGQEEADNQFQELFIGKKNNDTFITNHQALHHYFSTLIDVSTPFRVRISEIVPHHYVCFEQFKHHFKIKTNKEVHLKMIEVFSFRDDISLRRNMVEEALKLMLSKHMIEAPQYLILRKQEDILNSLRNNPDYNIYKLEHNFREFVRSLALKQVKETLLIDQLMHHEHIHANDADVRGYFNLLKRPRTKEFVYFQPPSTKLNGREFPIANAIIEKVVAREKTLNHLIHHLTKK